MRLVDQADLPQHLGHRPDGCADRRREAAREKHLRAMIVAILLA
jgi:hypothetical protein